MNDLVVKRMILLGATLVTISAVVLGIASVQSKKQHEAATKADLFTGKTMFLGHC